MICCWAGIQAGRAAASTSDEGPFNGVVTDVSVGWETVSVHTSTFYPEQTNKSAVMAVIALTCCEAASDMRKTDESLC